MSVVGGILDRMSSRHLPETGRLANIATSAELMSAGISAKQIRGKVSRGELVRLDHGIYAPAERIKPVTATEHGALALRAAVALAPLGPQAVASHHTAAQLLGLALLGRVPASTAITKAPGTGSRKGAPGVRVHSAALPAGQVGQCYGLPVTSAARTVLDLARCSSLRAGVVVADSALYRERVTRQELQAVLDTCRRWPGVQRAAEVVAFADALAESPLESIARVAFRDCGLPPPQLQALLGADGQVIARVDFYWERFRTVAEADGEMKYDNRFAATHQLRRDADLRDAGFEVVHFGWRDIYDTPVQVAASIRAAFRRGTRGMSAAADAS